ncbi:MAG: hypothetical protein M1170_01355, partial [Patescibacteria group bacterium]|nr:hypothetical protein [Patescibacteria group bacterium]
VLAARCLAPPKAGLGGNQDFERQFEIQFQLLPAQAEVRTNLFSFVRQLADERVSDNLILTV